MNICYRKLIDVTVFNHAFPALVWLRRIGDRIHDTLHRGKHMTNDGTTIRLKGLDPLCPQVAKVFLVGVHCL